VSRIYVYAIHVLIITETEDVRRIGHLENPEGRFLSSAVVLAFNRKFTKPDGMNGDIYNPKTR